MFKLSNNKKGRYKKYIAILWISASFCGVAYYLFQNRDVLSIYFTELTPTQAIFSFGFIIICKSSTLLQMGHTLKIVGKEAGLVESLKLYSYPDITKYIPGGIWPIIGRISLYINRNMTSKQVALAFFLENSWLVVGAIGIGFTIWSLSLYDLPVLPVAIQWVFEHWSINRESIRVLIPFIAALIVLLMVVFVVIVLYFFVSRFRFKDVVYALFTWLLIWVPAGISFVVLLPQFDGSISVQTASAGAFILAFGIGLAAVFAPGGFGIRESLVVVLLMPVFAPGVVLTAVLLNRILWFAADVCFAIVAFRLNRADNQSGWT